MHQRHSQSGFLRALRGQPASVLVVDDEPMMCDLLRNMLEDKFEVTTFSNPRAALDCMSGGAFFEIVLCDIMMPGLSGMDLHALTARENPTQAERFVFMTGGASTTRLNTFIDELRRPVLRKPFRMSQLCQAIEERLVDVGNGYTGTSALRE